MTTFVTMSLPPVQVMILINMLQFEIKHPGMQMSRESGLHAFKRLTEIDSGRGVKGRQAALDLLLQYQELADMQGPDDEPEGGWDA